MTGRRNGAAIAALLVSAAAIVFVGIPGAPVRPLAGPIPAHAQISVTLPGLSSTTTASTPSSEMPPSSASTIPEQTTTVTEVSTTESTDTSVPETLSEPSTELAVSPVSSSPPTSRPVPRAPARLVTAAPATSISAALTGSYGLGVATVFVIAIGLLGLAARATTRGGPPLTAMQRRWRLAAGFGCLGAAAIVGLIGYLRLSLEPAVNRQIPYLASAGMALVILAAAGGSFIVAEQLRRDDDRLDELEAAVRSLADTLSPLIEAPARQTSAPPPDEPEDPSPTTPPPRRSR